MARSGDPPPRSRASAPGLFERASSLQARLALRWGEAAWAAAGEFGRLLATRVAATAAAEPMTAYDEWIECAERAYGREARSDEFCGLLAELCNVLCSARIAGRAAPTPAMGAVGRSPGCSLRQPVWRRGKTVLYRYLPLPFAPSGRTHPVLICYAQINRPHVLDLEPERSLVRQLVAAGHTVYLIDWGYPDEADRNKPLAEYLLRDLGGAVGQVLALEGVAALDLIGVCQGGAFSLCYTALHPAQIANLVLMVTPVDFRTSGDLLSRWVGGLDTELIRRAGNVSGAVLHSTFIALAPFRLLQQKYVHFLSSRPSAADLERFLRLERWLGDSPDQPAAAFAQYLRSFYQENRLFRGGLTLGSRRVELRHVRQPILNVYGMRDHIVPAPASMALRGRSASIDYTELPIDTGHIGMYVSRRAAEVPRRISAWLAERA